MAVTADERILIRSSRVAAAWALGYACYRFYYAVGGTFGMFGTPASMQQWRMVNLTGAVILSVVAALPLAILPAWSHERARPALLVLCWLMAVGAIVHAMVGITQRVASLSGAYVMPFPFWESVDRRASDLQALFFNEPWFLAEGLLWVCIAWGGALSRSPRRWWWLGTALGGILVLTAAGILSAFRVIGRVIVG